MPPQRMLTTASVLLMAVVATVLAVPPVAWGPKHRHVEIMYSLATPGYVQFKQFNFDFPGLSMRVDATYLAGPTIDELVNLTSWWVNDTLTMLVQVGSLPSCTQLDMGFGMPVPDWFLFNATTMEPGLYLTRQYNKSDQWYHRAVWTRKSAMPDGYFNYFSFNDTGAPFRMNAPSPMGEVVNEYYDFENVTSFAPGIFDVPSACNQQHGADVRVDGGAPVEVSMGRLRHALVAKKKLPLHAVEAVAMHFWEMHLMGATRQ